MNSKYLLSLLIFLAVLLSVSVEALKCYECRTCREPFSAKDFNVSIVEGCKVCSKVKSIEFGLVSRACSEICIAGSDGVTETSCCTKNLCNASSSTFKVDRSTAAFFLGLASFLLLKL